MTRPQLTVKEPLIAYETDFGCLYQGLAEEALKGEVFKNYKGKVDLILTSPPFPLNRKKRYGNLQGEEYLEWLSSFAPLFRSYLKPKGSIVMEIGNAWEAGRPVMSTLSLRALLSFLDKGRLVLCEQFVAYNPAKLPTPVQWVNVERIRVKDSYTHVWWMAKTDRPKADNRQVLKPYSASMLELLEKQDYNSGHRPSDHTIGETSFLTDNKGAIPSNVITVANTHANQAYQKYCKLNNIPPHPARMAKSLCDFFIKYLTAPGGLVLDPFAGSNTTGAAAEGLERRWIGIEPNDDYIDGSAGRFDDVRY